MRLRRTLIAVGVVILLVDTGILAARSRDEAKPLTAADAVTRFRSTTQTPTASATTTSSAVATSTTVRPATSHDLRRAPAVTLVAAPARTRPALPAEGVYLYATTGREHVDILGGASHDYPPETTITIRHEGCGMRDRWDALKGRWDSRRICVTDRGLTTREVVQHHEFFGRADERTFVCDGDAVSTPRDPKPGATWTTQCHGDDAAGSTLVRAMGIEDIVVGGVRVRTYHFHSLTTMTGASRGTQAYDDWMVPSTGLLVRRVSSLDSRANSPIGTAHYQEQYELRLTSLTPRT